MQILVVVANIQSRTLKTEVGKVSVRTALGHGAAGSNPSGKLPSKGKVALGTSVPVSFFTKGEREIGQHSYARMRGYEMVTSVTMLKPRWNGPKRVLFSL